ncbi:MAG: helix-turn-helix transcriptional regulator [Candidatus Dactylopiibacterium sp.]|nr:helix-turn-helix transcriptional regulator [Candidatus Dactylopiibacterium sp.]
MDETQPTGEGGALARHDALFAGLYDGVMAAGGFQRFIEGLAECFALKAVTLIIRHVESGEVRGLWLHGLSQTWLERYALTYATQDVLAEHISRSPIASFYASNLDVPHPERFAATRFYSEWLAPQGVACAAGAVVLQEGPWATQMILQRGASQAAFTRAEMQALDALVPHLQRAIQMRQRFTELQLGQVFLVGGLDVLAMPTFLFDERGRLVHHNLAAARLLEEGVLSLHDGHLRTGETASTRRLGFEIANAVRASRGEAGVAARDTALRIARGQRLPLMLMVAPLPLGATARGCGAALVFAFDPDSTPGVTVERVRQLFGLSRAESELAVGLCSGHTLDDIARARGTSIHTIKSQLKNVFAKTGTRRQSELVSLLFASPAYFLAQTGAGGA